DWSDRKHRGRARAAVDEADVAEGVARPELAELSAVSRHTSASGENEVEPHPLGPFPNDLLAGAVLDLLRAARHLTDFLLGQSLEQPSGLQHIDRAPIRHFGDPLIFSRPQGSREHTPSTATFLVDAGTRTLGRARSGLYTFQEPAR